MINENSIQSENIYNFNKTGFAIDFISAQKINITVGTLFYNQRTLYIIFKDKNYIKMNKKKCQKLTRSTQQIAYKGDLSVEEDLQLAQQLN
ncbi:hypothetical protein N7450_011769, partial [Penicillium hetheringtonii]